MTQALPPWADGSDISFVPEDFDGSYAQWVGVTPLGSEEVGFTDEEADAFLSGITGMQMSDQDAALVADASEQTGAMIALVPADPGSLSVPGGESSDELHLTLCYLGEAAKIPPAKRQAIVEEMTYAAKNIPVVDANVFGASIWNGANGEKQTAVVLNVGGGELEDAYEDVWKILRVLLDDDEVPDQYEPWMPHICVAYTNDANLVTQLQSKEGMIRFDRLRVAFAGQSTDIPLYDGSDLTSGDIEMGETSTNAEYDDGLTAADISPEARQRAAKKGNALPDGSFPIRNVNDLKNAIQAIGRSKNPGKARALIRRRAKELGQPGLIPDTWDLEDTGIETDFAGKKESDVNLKGGNHNLKNYWTHGPGAAKIGWGTDGSFARCVVQLGKYVARPQGLCAEYHKAATGEWPTQGGKHGIPSAVDIGLVWAADTVTLDWDKVMTAAGATQVEHDGSWTGVIAVEDVETGDQRKFAAGSITWVDPKQVVAPLQWAKQNLGEHKGSVTVGRIDKIWRDATDPRVIRGAGKFDLEDPDGQEAFRKVKDGFLSGISIDPDQVTDADVELIYPEGFSSESFGVKPDMTIYHAGRIRGATLVAFPAFIEGAIQLTSKDTSEAVVASVTTAPWRPAQYELLLGEEIDGLVASAAFAYVRELDEVVDRRDCRFLHHEITDDGKVGPANLVACARHIDAINSGRTFGVETSDLFAAYQHLAEHIYDAGQTPAAFALETEVVVAAGVPEAAPLEWFVDPKLAGPTPVTVTEDGRVFGHAAAWGSCHTSYADQCVTPPREPDYSFFTTGEVVTATGERVAVGQITLGTSHAATRGLSVAKVVDHYGDTGTAVADVTAGVDAHGIWVAGAVRPGVSPEHLHALRASALSGDWRRIGGQLRMVALLAVNVPGFPLPRVTTSFQDQRQLTLVAAGAIDRDHVDFTAELEKLAGSCGIPLPGMKKKKMYDLTMSDELEFLKMSVDVGAFNVKDSHGHVHGPSGKFIGTGGDVKRFRHEVDRNALRDAARVVSERNSRGEGRTIHDADKMDIPRGQPNQKDQHEWNQLRKLHDMDALTPAQQKRFEELTQKLTGGKTKHYVSD